MTAPLLNMPLAIPSRIWFANTDMQSFYELPRTPGDNSAFAYWLAANRLYVTPNARKPRKYHNALAAMTAGDPVFAYEDGVGFVALGWVRSPKHLRASLDETGLYPKPTEMVRSLAVEWDTSVRRTAQHVEQQDIVVAGYALRQSRPGSQLHRYLVGMLQQAHEERQADPDAREAETLAQISASPAYDAVTRAQLIRARIGQGRFRDAVLTREPACRLTGITQRACLVASHIKPWAVCAGGEHLDGANGLMLAPHADHLFDTGLISFEDNGRLLLAPMLDREILRAWHIDAAANVGAFGPDQARYLMYHREHVFGRARIRHQRNLVGDAPASVLYGESEAPDAATMGGA